MLSSLNIFKGLSKIQMYYIYSLRPPTQQTKITCVIVGDICLIKTSIGRNTGKSELTGIHRKLLL